jgi:alkyl hydroperoxide reductase subunit F
MQDLIIIGGGPAGCAAAVYAARKLLKTTLITEIFGGQSIDSADVQNWIGTPHIPGVQLAKDLEAHVRAYAGDVVTIAVGERVTKVEKKETGFVVTTSTGNTHEARAILVGTGGARRKLKATGADLFEHKGLTYCATCDGPLFGGQDVAVIGGGNAAFETAAQLLAYCKSVTLLSRSEFRADPITVEMLSKDAKMKAIPNTEILEVSGDTFVKNLKYSDKDGEHTLNVSGIFVEIGLMPSTDFLQGVVTLDEINRVVIDPWTQRTSVEGIWAAGDCTNELYHQNNIAAGDAVKALEDIYVHLKTK